MGLISRTVSFDALWSGIASALQVEGDWDEAELEGGRDTPDVILEAEIDIGWLVCREMSVSTGTPDDKVAVSVGRRGTGTGDGERVCKISERLSSVSSLPIDIESRLLSDSLHRSRRCERGRRVCVRRSEVSRIRRPMIVFAVGTNTHKQRLHEKRAREV